MASKKQLAANRVNARRSTGPKSERGKARSRTNAITHGLTAKQVIVPGETPEQFEKLRRGLIADFAPGTTIERELVDQLAALLLRRRRAPIVEAALLKRVMGPSIEEFLHLMTTEEFDQLAKRYREALGLQGEPDLTDVVERQPAEGDRKQGIPRRVEMLNVFARYETHITNEIIKTVKLIHFLQERRLNA